MSLSSYTHKAATPKHVAIIMDGNGRWANRRFMPRVYGHRKGAVRVREIVEAAAKAGVEVLTLYAFSTENWQRPKDEIHAIMKLLDFYLVEERSRLAQNNVSLGVIGDLGRLPERSQMLIKESMQMLASNTGLRLNLGLSYGGREEILRVTKKLCKLASDGDLDPNTLDERNIASHLDCSVDVDLMIRTSGEQRISNFMLWQMSYAEFYFTPVLWPDFTADEFQLALQHYASRQRRFGQVLTESAESTC
jgi:undecaprenyl diphosphate synthase